MSTNVKGQSLPYKVLPLTELNKIKEKKQDIIDTVYINDYNAVFVTIFKDGTAILSPPVLGGHEGLFFYDIEAMHAMIASREYPVKGTGTFWEKEKERIEHISTSIPYYCTKLSELLDFKVEVKDDTVYLKELSTVISNKMKAKKQPKYLKIYLSIYIGELIRRRVDGEWKLFTEYAFHIYYIPRVVKEEKSCDVISFIIGELEITKFMPFDMEYVINKAKERFYPYNKDRYVSVK